LNIRKINSCDIYYKYILWLQYMLNMIFFKLVSILLIHHRKFQLYNLKIISFKWLAVSSTSHTSVCRSRWDKLTVEKSRMDVSGKIANLPDTEEFFPCYKCLIMTTKRKNYWLSMIFSKQINLIYPMYVQMNPATAALALNNSFGLVRHACWWKTPCRFIILHIRANITKHG
jgi:hypothetical protein